MNHGDCGVLAFFSENERRIAATRGGCEAQVRDEFCVPIGREQASQGRRTLGILPQTQRRLRQKQIGEMCEKPEGRLAFVPVIVQAGWAYM